MFGAEHHQFLRQSDEIKRLRCETLACRMPRVSRRFEFGGIFTLPAPTVKHSSADRTHADDDDTSHVDAVQAVESQAEVLSLREEVQHFKEQLLIEKQRHETEVATLTDGFNAAPEHVQEPDRNAPQSVVVQLLPHVRKLSLSFTHLLCAPPFNIGYNMSIKSKWNCCAVSPVLRKSPNRALAPRSQS